MPSEVILALRLGFRPSAWYNDLGHTLAALGDLGNKAGDHRWYLPAIRFRSSLLSEVGGWSLLLQRHLGRVGVRSDGRLGSGRWMRELHGICHPAPRPALQATRLSQSVELKRLI